MSSRLSQLIALVALIAIAVHLSLLGSSATERPAAVPLLVALVIGGLPLVFGLVIKMFRREFGSDLLAGLSILTAMALGEYLAGTIVVLMLSGGEALEAYAVRSASSVLAALSKRMPSIAHRTNDAREVRDVALSEIVIDDQLVIFPHEVCPVDGIVIEGKSVMDESYLTGEPYKIAKAPGSSVISGAINGTAALTIRASKLPEDSRYAQIIRVMESSQLQRPRIRRLGDQLGAVYTPIALVLAVLAWWISGDAVRFLAVLVVATPCPLLIAIPVAVIGSISLAAKRAIVIRNPAILEKIDRCRTIIFDKTGTLTYGEPKLVEHVPLHPSLNAEQVLGMVASCERFSKHPLAEALIHAGESAKSPSFAVEQISEMPGQGLQATVAGHAVRVTNRAALIAAGHHDVDRLPPSISGMECVALIDNQLAAVFRFRDTPRAEGASFIRHLQPLHGFNKVMLVSGDRATEVHYLAEQVGVREVFADQSPEDKLQIVVRESKQADTVFVGDGINDAPALTAATVGLAFGNNSDVTTEAADAVILDSSLKKVDELLHISQRMRRIALQSAIGGMAASIVGMLLAAAGFLPPVSGAILQELIDVLAVANALRAAWPPKLLTDFA